MAPPIVLARNPIKKIYIGKLPFLLNFKPFSFMVYVHTENSERKEKCTQE